MAKILMAVASQLSPRTEAKAAAFPVERRATGPETAGTLEAETAETVGAEETSEDPLVAATTVESPVTLPESAVARVVIGIAVVAIVTTPINEEAAVEADRAPGHGRAQGRAPREGATVGLLLARIPGPSQGTVHRASHARGLPDTAGSARAAVARVDRLLPRGAHHPQGQMEAKQHQNHPWSRMAPILPLGQAVPAEALLPWPIKRPNYSR